MKIRHLYHLLLFLLLLPVAALAQPESCPRIWRSGDTLYTDPAAQIQWYRNDAPIPGASRSWYVPEGTQQATYRVEVRGGYSPTFTYAAPEVPHVLFGHVVDELHRPLAGVSVRQGSRQATTDAQGRFRLETERRTDRPDAPVLVLLERTGYWRTTLRQLLNADTATAARYQLRTQQPTNQVEARQGGVLLFPQFTLALPPNGYETLDGRPYSGTVLVHVDSRSPQHPDFGLAVPGGDLAVADRDQFIDAVGFAAVELKTTDGRELRLRPGVSARLRFPITPQTARADSVELWHHDPVGGTWQKEGWGYRTGNSLEGSVRHFSAWAAGERRERAWLTGQLVDCSGQPMAWGLLRLNQRLVVADGRGRFRAWVPAATEVVVWAEGREVARVNLAAGERRELSALVRARRWDGLGLYNGDEQRLDIFVVGDVPPNLRFSVDGGQSWFTERQRGGLAQVPDSVWADDGCRHRLRVVVVERRHDCRALSPAQLDSVAANHPDQVARSVADLRNASAPVVAANFRDQAGPIPFELLAAQPCLQDLNLDNTGGTGLPATIGEMTQLVRLELARRNIGTLPVQIGQLTRLEFLDLGAASLTTLPTSITNLTALRTLRLGSNPIAELPADFGRLTELRQLWLHFNTLPNGLPESFRQLRNLEELALQDAQWSELPGWFGELQSLRSLGLSYTGITQLPASFTSLTALDSVDLRQNRLQALPADFGNLQRLRQLILDSNQLTTLPASFANLQSLRGLSMYNNLFGTVPGALGSLSQLRSLSLHSCRLNELPPFMGNLTALEAFDVGNNSLTELPTEFANLVALDYLNVSHNPLAIYPDVLNSLPALKNLVLNNCQLTDLPPSIDQLADTLRELNLSGNPIPVNRRAAIQALLPNTNITW